MTAAAGSWHTAVAVPVRVFENHVPNIDPSARVDPLALVIGRVSVGAQASLWPYVVARGDVNTISIGARSNIQDGTILHVTHAGPHTGEGFSLHIGAGVTVGHRAVLHGCRIADGCLIGMGAMVMDGAVVESQSIIGAGALVPPGKHLAGGGLWVGSPVRRARALTGAELALLEYSAEQYVRLQARYAAT